MPAIIKEALRMQGRNGGRARNPMSPVSPPEREQVERALRDAGALMAHA
jgi:4-hydroxy-tetrahydrodipicolinate synthase